MIALVAIFGSVAALTGGVLLLVMGGEAPEQRRLKDVVAPRASKTPMMLADMPEQLKGRLAAFVPRSPKDMSRLQKRLAKAGIHGIGPALVYRSEERRVGKECRL